MAKYYFLRKDLADRAGWLRWPVWVLEAAVFYLLLGLVQVMPYPVAARTIAHLAGRFGPRNRQKYRVVKRNISFVLPHASEADRAAVVNQIFRSTGLAAVELFLLRRLWRRRARYIEFSINPEARAAIARGEASVFATAHVGAWQLCNLIGRECGVTISVIYARESNPWVHRFFLDRRRAFGGPLVPSAGGARMCLRELAAGRSIGAAFDTRVESGEMVPFFGVPTPTGTLPAMLAVRGYTLLPIRAVRLPNFRYRIEVMAPLRPSDPNAAREQRIFDLTWQLNRHFEEWIRETPGEWICMKRRWPKQAATEQPADV